MADDWQLAQLVAILEGVLVTHCTLHREVVLIVIEGVIDGVIVTHIMKANTCLSVSQDGSCVLGFLGVGGDGIDLEELAHLDACPTLWVHRVAGLV